MRNLKIRNLARERGVCLWEIAERLDILDCNFSRKLRRELPETEQEKICAIIEQIAEEREAG